MRSWSELAIDVLLPRTCAGCEEDIPAPLQGPICGDCLYRIAPLSGRRCLKCDGFTENHTCPVAGALSSVRAAFPYGDPIRSMIHDFKFCGRMATGRILAAWQAALYAERSAERGAGCRRAEVVTAVPLYPSKERRRGFNQAEILARWVAYAAGLPYADLLERNRKTPALWGLTRSRRAAALAGSFAPKMGTNIDGKWVLLVDDVCTTGATLRECAEALRENGAARVDAYVLARD